MAEAPRPPIDPTVPDPARRYDYWLGGKDNYQVDRDSGDFIAKHFPTIRTAARENRKFMRRAVTALAKDGIDQFLDVGTGLPTAPNVHQVAHAVNPKARVVYVDNSPVVLVHARALLVADPGATATAYINADLKDPSTILDSPALRETIDLKRPVGLLLVAVMHFILDEDHPYEIVRELVDALPSGSALVLSHLSGELISEDVPATFGATTAQSGIRMAQRSLAEIRGFVAGLEVAPPGIVPVNRWRAEDEPDPRPTDAETAMYGLLARKP